MTKFYTSLMMLVLAVLTLKGQVTVTATSGIPSKNYTSLRAAFTAINTGYHLGDITILISGSVTETATATLNASSGLSNYNRIKIKPAVASIISGNVNGPLIDLNDADSVTIDGRINDTDTTRQLTLQNLYNGDGNNVATIRFTNGASYNTLQYVNIEGASTTTGSGTILIAGGSYANGNNDNTITRSEIRPAGEHSPNTAINAIAASYGRMRIYDNLLHDFATGISSSAIGAFTITRNSFYQTKAVTGSVAYINLRNEEDSWGRERNLITHNLIGGSGPYCTGTAIHQDGTSVLGIFTDASSTIDSNVIRNFRISTKSNTFSFYGILASGKRRVNSRGNQIGTLINDSAIVIQFSGPINKSYICGIQVEADTLDIQQNEIGGLYIDGAGAVNTQLSGITVSNSSHGVIRLNTIGGSTKGKLQITTASGGINGILLAWGKTGKYTCIQNTVRQLYNNNSGVTATVTGIKSYGLSTSVNLTVETKVWNNNISSLHATQASVIDGSVRGISMEAPPIIGTNSFNNTIIRGNQIEDLTTQSRGDTTVVIGISNRNPYYRSMSVDTNTIRHLESAGTSEDAFLYAAVQGISIMTSNGGRPVNVTGNRIYYLESTATASTYVVGINALHNSDSSIFSLTRNHIYYLSNNQAKDGVVAGMMLNGIRDAGKYDLINNMIILRPDNVLTYGITNMFAAAQLRLYNNTIHIGGKANSNHTSAAFYRSFFSKAKVVTTNNIFYNVRTGGSGKHYAVMNDNGAPGWTASNFNNLFSSNPATVFLWDSINLSMAAYRDSTHQDSCSKSQTVDFVEPVYANVHLQQTTGNQSLSGSPVFGLLTDFDGKKRHSTPAMGADEIEIPGQVSPVLTAMDTPVTCMGDSVRINSSLTSGNEWYRNDTLIAGVTGTQYAAKESGTYHVLYRSGCTIATSNYITVRLKPVPPKPRLSEPPNNPVFCPGSYIYLDASRWLEPGRQWYRNDTAIVGENNHNYRITTAGAYYYTFTIDGCESLPSDTVNASTYPLSPPASISIDGQYLVSSFPYNNRWFYNGNRLLDSTQRCRIRGTGQYWVDQQPPGYNCGSRSDTLNYVAPAAAAALALSSHPMPADEKMGMTLQLFPNPATDLLKVNATGFEGPVTLSIYDVSGRQKLTQRTNYNGIMQVDVQRLSNGTYLLELRSAKGKATKWFTKIQ